MKSDAGENPHSKGAFTVRSIFPGKKQKDEGMNILKRSAHAVAALGFMAFGAVSIASAQTAPIPNPNNPAAFPPFGQCSTNTIPDLPKSWSSNALLTPFESQPLQVARVMSGDMPGERYMLTVTDNVPSTTTVAWLTVTSKASPNIGRSFKIINGADGNLQCSPAQLPPNVQWRAPNTDYLAKANCTCMGSNEVIGIKADAWRCPNGQKLNATTDAYDWFWYSQGNNPRPVRYLFSRPNNKQSLPVLGNAAMTHFTSFDGQAQNKMGDYITACLGNGPVQTKLPQPAVQGVSFESKKIPQPPVWTDKAFSNGALFAIDGTYTSMASYYDWTIRQEVTKILSSAADLKLYPNNPKLADTRLTKGRTYQVSYDPKGNRVFPKNAQESQMGGILGNVGIWRPDWAKYDNCQYKATIAAASPLNPTRSQPLKALSCFFAQHIGGAESNIQAWYTYSDEPVMFYETNAGDLDLIDYVSWMPNATIPPGVLYDIPAHVQKLPPAMMTDCNACHGKIHN